MDKDELLTTVKFLVNLEEADARRYSNALSDVLSLSHRYQLKFRGDFAVLNPLIDLHYDDKDVYNDVIQMVNKRRDDSVFDNRSRKYMAEFMREKRAREKRALDIENASRPESQQLKGTARLNFLRKVSNEWNERRLNMLAQAREQAGGRLTTAKSDELLALFWKQIDKELDELEG